MIVNYLTNTHALPESKDHTCYRLKQVDPDAPSSYSAIHMVKFGDGNAKVIVLHPNPVNDMSQAAIYENKIQIAINTPNGNTVRRRRASG